MRSRRPSLPPSLHLSLPLSLLNLSGSATHLHFNQARCSQDATESTQNANGHRGRVSESSVQIHSPNCNGRVITPCVSRLSLFSLFSPSAADLGCVPQTSEVGATLPHGVPRFDLLICPHAPSLAFNQPPVVPRNGVNKHTHRHVHTYIEAYKMGKRWLKKRKERERDNESQKESVEAEVYLHLSVSPSSCPSQIQLHLSFATPS